VPSLELLSSVLVCSRCILGERDIDVSISVSKSQ
jgi:hypothetical protein